MQAAESRSKSVRARESDFRSEFPKQDHCPVMESREAKSRFVRRLKMQEDYLRFVAKDARDSAVTGCRLEAAAAAKEPD